MLKQACPCLFDEQSGKNRVVEMSPFRTDGSNSDDGVSTPEQGQETIADKAKSWLSMAAAPLSTLQAHRAESAAHQQRVDRLKAGEQMKLLPTGRGEPTMSKVALSQDGTMITWQSGSTSGVLALSAIREVKVVLETGFLRKGGPVPCQWSLVADDQTVQFEAESEAVKTEWMEVIEVRDRHACAASRGRSVPHAHSIRALCRVVQNRPKRRCTRHRCCVRRRVRRRRDAKWPTKQSGRWGWRSESGRQSVGRRRCSRAARRVGCATPRMP